MNAPLLALLLLAAAGPPVTRVPLPGADKISVLDARTGAQVTLSSWSNVPHLVLFFWSPECLECVDQLRYLGALQRSFPGTTVLVVAVVYGDVDVERIKRQTSVFSLHTLIDADGELWDALGKLRMANSPADRPKGRVLPTTYLVGIHGAVRHVGAARTSEEAFVAQRSAAIQRLATGPKPPDEVVLDAPNSKFFWVASGK